MAKYNMQAVVEAVHLFTSQYPAYVGSEDTISRLLWQSREDAEFRSDILEILGVSEGCIKQQCSSGAEQASSKGPTEQELKHIEKQIPGSRNEPQSEKRKLDQLSSPSLTSGAFCPREQSQPPSVVAKSVSPTAEYPPRQPSTSIELNIQRPTELRITNLWDRQPTESDIRRVFRDFVLWRMQVQPGRRREDTVIIIELPSRTQADRFMRATNRREVRGHCLVVSMTPRRDSR